MWDSGALYRPVGHPSSQPGRRRRRTARFETCTKVSSAPKDAHYLRVNPCFYEKEVPLCFLLKVTASANTSVGVDDRIRGWGEFHPLRSEKYYEKKVRVLKKKHKKSDRVKKHKLKVRDRVKSYSAKEREAFADLKVSVADSCVFLPEQCMCATAGRSNKALF